MGPLDGIMAIVLRNKLGNFCPDCQAELRATKAGRWKLRFLSLKILLISGSIFLVLALIFAALTYALSLQL